MCQLSNTGRTPASWHCLHGSELTQHACTFLPAAKICALQMLIHPGIGSRILDRQQHSYTDVGVSTAQHHYSQP